MKKLFTLGIALAFACAAYAYPTLTGPTGLANLPTAGIVGAGGFNVAVDYYDMDGEEAIPIRLLYGLNDTVELGASYWMQDGVDAFMLNAKWVTPLTLLDMPWALGLQYADFDFDGTATQFYFVGTRPLLEGDDTMPAINGTFGVNWTMYEEDDALDDEDAFRFFLGFDATFANNLMLALEYQTKSSDLDEDALWSLLARYPFTETITGQIGYTNGFGGVIGLDDSNLFAGVNFAWGGTE